jgi:hypothetical protein
MGEIRLDILFTGRLSSAAYTIAAQLISGGYNVVFASDDINEDALGKKITPFRISPSDKDFERIFSSYNFGAAVYIAQSIYRKEPYYGEYQDLEAVLRISCEHEIPRVVCVSPKYQSTENGIAEHDLAVMFSACDMLCDFYRKSRGISILKLSAPCIYGYGETASAVGSAVRQARITGAVSLYGDRGQDCAFISQKDFGELLLRIMDSWPDTYDEIDVPPGDVMKFDEFGSLLKEEFPTVRISYAVSPLSADVNFSDAAVRREYDWIPLLSLRDELKEAAKFQEDRADGEKRAAGGKIRKFLNRHSFVVKLAELFAGFLLMELLNRLTSTTVQFNYVDFRLLYIVLMGTLHGIKTGLAASALASLSLLSDFIEAQSKWEAVAFDIDTWLPYIFFFLIGAVTGYVKDRLQSENRFLSEEKQILEDKYILLNEFYISALNNKDKYRTQIMSYRDSFGRLFEITKRLDSTTVEHVFLESLYALEGILDNHSICIYRCDSEMKFARLVICSKEIFKITDKTLKLGEFDRMLPSLRDDNVWSNRERLPSYPEYATVLYHDGTPIVLITLKKASRDQLSVYYENLIKIVCGLIKISLIRAIEYNSKIETEKYVDGSCILKNEYFRELVTQKEEMAQSGTSEYMLLRIGTTPGTRVETANKISSIVRSTDELGLGKDGELYLCLSQTNIKNVRHVFERMKKMGLEFSAAGTAEQEDGV